LYTPATSNTAICLTKAQRQSKTRNLLPDDKHFNSRQLLQLFLKPKAWMGSRRPDHADSLTHKEPARYGDVDEAYWARQERFERVLPSSEDAQRGNYDAHFFQDDGLSPPAGLDDDEDDFADARDHFSPGLDGEPPTPGGFGDTMAITQDGPFGTQLVTQNRRLRPDYVQYARVAKKVDVRRLKEEMWLGMGLQEVRSHTPSLPTRLYAEYQIQMPERSKPLPSVVSRAEDGSLKFTEVMNNLQGVYSKQAMADISTSYCFICLLHLANEQGLMLSHEPDFQDLNIKKDMSAEIGVEAG
jgi:condensin complex subunit 2